MKRFNLKTREDLETELARVGAALPWSDDLSPLGQPLVVAGRKLANRFVVQPMEGVDACDDDGTPSELTFRRYRRYAAGGSALIWFESVAVVPEGRSGPRQMMLTGRNLAAWQRLVEETRQAARETGCGEVTLLLQLTHSGRYSRPQGKPAPITAQRNPLLEQAMPEMPVSEPISDDALDRLVESFVATAKLAERAGFDGVDMKAVHGYLVAELLGARRREGRFGGSYENRTRFLKVCMGAMRQTLARDMWVASRLTVLEPTAYPYGWGVAECEGPWQADLTEPLRLIGELTAKGTPLHNISMGYPRFQPHLNRPHDRALAGCPPPPEDPLCGVVRFQETVRAVRRAAQGTPVITAALSWLRHLAPQVAAGLIREGWCDLVGFGRSSFAYPDAPHDILRRGGMIPDKCCVTCSMCSQIMKDVVGRGGCVVRDAAIYAPEYRRGREAARMRPVSTDTHM
ncbi:MAG TPA: NADH:flavin oxidoreductase [Kiritimatiellia bacterium]|nr:NADH:flavin oxidoreductase [Kiritimatiellia bacterium]HRU70815.1 NADH:flavin oxidoreductase [Kiritimatiellia bacterium]